MVPERYRDNVCAVIRHNADDSVLVFHRKGTPLSEGWQFPQGGIDYTKGIIDELKRELREEIGADDITVIAFSTATYTYDFPEDVTHKHTGYRGQRQTWALVTLNTGENALRFDQSDAEFDAFEWVSPGEVLSRIVDFKREIYRRALTDLGLL